jgi:hypothetical protein
MTTCTKMTPVRQQRSIRRIDGPLGVAGFTAAGASMPPAALAALRPPAAPPGGRVRTPIGDRRSIRRIDGPLGVARADRDGVAGKRRQDAGAQPASSERRAGCPKGASGEMARATNCTAAGASMPPAALAALRPPAAPPGGRVRTPIGDRRSIRRIDGPLGVARADRDGVVGKRRQDAGAQPASSDRRAGCPKGASGEMARATPMHSV